MNIRFGTRGSALALWQTNYVMAELTAANATVTAAYEIYSTKGDRVIDVPLPQVGGKGLFTAELEAALHAGDIDCAVHSLKDLPTEQPVGLALGAIMPRADARDVLISRSGKTLLELPQGAVIGTSSHRRGAQLKAIRPDIQLADIRGNVDTRIKKALDTAGQYDAIMLASAGLDRLGFVDVITERLSPEFMLPAPGQGAVTVQMRSEWDGHAHFTALHCVDTAMCVTAERAFLAGLGGGCSVPVAAYAIVNNGVVEVTGRVCALDGSTVITVATHGTCDSLTDAAVLGATLAEMALAQGAATLLVH
ncbi:MAG: hydroxymethylbilane synthase [Armatimonadaceae bacterium]